MNGTLKVISNGDNPFSNTDLLGHINDLLAQQKNNGNLEDKQVEPEPDNTLSAINQQSDDAQPLPATKIADEKHPSIEPTSITATDLENDLPLEAEELPSLEAPLVNNAYLATLVAELDRTTSELEALKTQHESIIKNESRFQPPTNPSAKLDSLNDDVPSLTVVTNPEKPEANPINHDKSADLVVKPHDKSVVNPIDEFKSLIVTPSPAKPVVDPDHHDKHTDPVVQPDKSVVNPDLKAIVTPSPAKPVVDPTIAAAH